MVAEAVMLRLGVTIWSTIMVTGGEVAVVVLEQLALDVIRQYTWAPLARVVVE